MFTLSGVIVGWVPILVGFVIHHVKIKAFIVRTTSDQDEKIEALTAQQTNVIKALTSSQTAEIRHLTDEQTRELEHRDGTP